MLGAAIISGGSPISCHERYAKVKLLAIAGLILFLIALVVVNAPIHGGWQDILRALVLVALATAALVTAFLVILAAYMMV